MEITGISWTNEDQSWCLEVDEETYRKAMGDENWAIEKLVRSKYKDLPYTIQMDELLAERNIYYGNKVKITIQIEKIK